MRMLALPALGGLCVALGAGACRKSGGTAGAGDLQVEPVVLDVRVADRSPREDLRRPEAELRAGVVAGLVRSGAVAMRLGDTDAHLPGAAIVRIELRSDVVEDLRTSRGAVRIGVRARIEALGRSGPAPLALAEHQGMAEAGFALGEQDGARAAAARMVRRVVEDVACDLGRRVGLRRLDPRQLERMLAGEAGSDPDLRVEAVRVTGERKLASAVPALIRLLQDDDDELRDAAIGALRLIGDQRAVGPLGRLVPFADVDELPKIIDAIGTIGGPEATAYLEFVAGSHPSAELKAQAQKALEAMARRAAQSPPSR